MKKFLILLVLLLLTGCTSGQDTLPEDSAELLTYPLRSTSPYLEEAEVLPEIIFTTTASENGLSGTIYSFEGTVTEVMDETLSGGINTVIVETEYGTLAVADMYTALCENSPLTELAIAEEDCEYSLPAVEETVIFVCTYAGFSGTVDMPFLYLGANPFVVEDLRANNPSFDASEQTVEPTTVPSGFLSDADTREIYHESIKSWDWETLNALADAYIETEEPEEDDVVYEIDRILTENMDAFSACTRVTDPVEGFTTVTYPGADELGSSVHISPVLRDWDFYLSVGIMEEDWLFFDKVIVAANGEQLWSDSFDSWDVETNVLDGGIIQEQARATIIYTTPDFESIAEAESATIRFKNTSTDNWLDFELTTAEKEACQTMLSLWNAQSALQKLY